VLNSEKEALGVTKLEKLVKDQQLIRDFLLVRIVMNGATFLGI
jgi:hypothetical protein